LARTCTVCSHPEREAIDRALVEGQSSGKLAGRYRTLDERAIRRHRSNHLPTALARAREAEEVSRADDLLEQVVGLQDRALTILGRAENSGDLRTALGAIREARGNLELLAKLLGELDESPQVNILVSPEWITVRTALLKALTPHPEARAAVAGRLLQLEAGY
jgi:hypothetical protein